MSMDLHKVLGQVTALHDGQERHERLLEKLASTLIALYDIDCIDVLFPQFTETFDDAQI
jgi:hypothetical protein